MPFPFLGETNSGSYTPSDVARRRKLAEALMAQNMEAREPFGALAKGLTGARAGFEDRQASEDERMGRESFNERIGKLLSNPDASLEELTQGIGDPWANPAQAAIIGELIGSKYMPKDPLEINGQLVDPRSREVLGDYRTQEAPKPPTITEIYDPETGRGQKGYMGPNGEFTPVGGTEAPKDPLVELKQLGSIPPGYRVEYDENGNPVGMTPIPGSPAAMEAETLEKARAAKTGTNIVDTDVIVNAADIARNLAKKSGTTGMGGQVWGNLPETEAAELRRQVGVLKSKATIESLNAMRAESPTGGALGNVTEKEGAMLAAAAGAIDPNAKQEDFQRQLDDYERTLLRVVHGPQEGDRIYAGTRKAAPEGGEMDWNAAQPPETWKGDKSLWQYMSPEDRALWK